jgi:hypothetical protein
MAQKEANGSNGEQAVTRPPPTPSPLRFSKFFQVRDLPPAAALFFRSARVAWVRILIDCRVDSPRPTCGSWSPVERASSARTSSTGSWRTRRTRYVRGPDKILVHLLAFVLRDRSAPFRGSAARSRMSDDACDVGLLDLCDWDVGGS